MDHNPNVDEFWNELQNNWNSVEFHQMQFNLGKINPVKFNLGKNDPKLNGQLAKYQQKMQFIHLISEKLKLIFPPLKLPGENGPLSSVRWLPGRSMCLLRRLDLPCAS